MKTIDHFLRRYREDIIKHVRAKRRTGALLEEHERTLRSSISGISKEVERSAELAHIAS